MDLTKLNQFMELERVNCEWAASQTMLDLINEIRDELVELEDEILAQNKNDIPEELADVFSDILLLIHIAERDGEISSKEDIVKRAYAKKLRRKGWVLEGKKLSRQEASRIWHTAKKLEKEKKVSA